MPSRPSPPTPRPIARDTALLGPQQWALLATLARCGSFAAAARELGLVPSALSYRVRQIEQTLDVLLFDRRSRRAQPTAAGAELMSASVQLLAEWEAVAQRVRRVATGWESTLTLVADAVIDAHTLLELCEAFYGLGAPTRLRLRSETLLGTYHALVQGEADIAIGVMLDRTPSQDLRFEHLGEVAFCFAVAPSHPLAALPEPLTPTQLRLHRIVAVADSAPGGGLSFGIQPGQDVLTVPTMALKLQAQLRGLGCGWLPEPLVQPYVDAGQLVVKRTTLPPRVAHVGYGWRQGRQGSVAATGPALQWWLQRLADPVTREALLMRRRA
jgi:molybdate transport repressor ModE-like protein